MNIEKFKDNWGSKEIPTELEKLIHFQNDISYFESYSDGFGVTIDDKLGLKSWSEETDFLNRLYPFAQANGSGSFYAIWDDGTNKNMSEMPIVVFGDEGGVHVVAENFVKLLHLITFDSEISVDFEEVYFYKGEDDYEESEDLNEYLNWLKDNYSLDKIQEPADLISAAQEKYKEAFDRCFKQYYDAE